MKIGFIKVAYTFWHMIFEVAVGSSCWCSVLGSDLCTGYSDLSVPVDWLNFLLSVGWLSFQWLIDSSVIDLEIDDWVIVIS